VWTINGIITNISNEPIEIVYVYLILRNPDGTIDFSTSKYDKIENLYVGETQSFEFSYIYYNESQTKHHSKGLGLRDKNYKASCLF
jgi:hypothetical protein